MGNENKTDIRVAAIVVTYNRRDLLIECLDALLDQKRQIDGLFIIDNASTDRTTELLIEKGFIKKPQVNLDGSIEYHEIARGLQLNYIRLSENTGGAGGFFEGVKRAYDNGFDWVWLMDDDAEPEKDALMKMAPYLVDHKTAAFGPAVKDTDNNILAQHRGRFNNDFLYNHKNQSFVVPISIKDVEKKTVEIDFISFVGLIVSREAIQKTGFPNKELFIHHDDVDYCYRLKKTGGIQLLNESCIYHKEKGHKGISKRGFFGKSSSRIQVESFWLNYYGRRNYIYIGMKYSSKRVEFLLQATFDLIKKITGVIIFDDFKLTRIRLLISAYFDGLFRRLGKRMTKEKWNEWLS